MQKWFLNVIMVVLKFATPELRDTMKDFLVGFKEKAAQTPNPVDDIIADALLIVFGVNDIEE